METDAAILDFRREPDADREDVAVDCARLRHKAVVKQMADRGMVHFNGRADLWRAANTSLMLSELTTCPLIRVR